MEPSLSPTARVVVTASSVHNPATGDPGKQATLGVGAQVFHVFPWLWHGKSMENRWTCASEMASKLKIGDFSVVWGLFFGKFRWNSEEQERNSLLIQDVGGIIQMKDARISSCWSWNHEKMILETLSNGCWYQRNITKRYESKLSIYFLPYPSDSLYHWYIVTMKRQEFSDFGVVFHIVVSFLRRFVGLGQRQSWNGGWIHLWCRESLQRWGRKLVDGLAKWWKWNWKNETVGQLLIAILLLRMFTTLLSLFRLKQSISIHWIHYHTAEHVVTTIYWSYKCLNLWHQYLWSSLHFCRFQALQRALHLGARSPLAPCPLSNFGRKMLGFRLVLGLVLNAKIWKNHSETMAYLLIVFQCFGKYEWNWRWPYLVGYFDRFQVFNSSEPLDCYASHNSSPGRRRARPSLRTALAQVWILTAEQISANKISWRLLIRTLAVLFTIGRFDPFQDLFSLPKPGGMRGSCGRYPADTPLFPAGPNFAIDVELLHSNMINAWLLVQSHSAHVNGKYHPIVSRHDMCPSHS